MGEEVGLHDVLQGHTGHSQTEVGGGDDRSHREAGVGADAERDGDAGGRDAIVAADLDQHGQDAVVQRVRRDGQTDEAAQEGEDEMQMLGQCGGQDVDDKLCHGDDHAGVVQDADHDTGGQNGGDQRDGFGSVCGETGFLLFGVRKVDDEGEHAAQHEDEVVGKLGGEEEHEDDDSQQDVVPEQLGAKELCGGFVHDFGLFFLSGGDVDLTGTALDFDTGHDDGQTDTADETADLQRQIHMPQLVGIHC